MPPARMRPLWTSLPSHSTPRATPALTYRAQRQAPRRLPTLALDLKEGGETISEPLPLTPTSTGRRRTWTWTQSSAMVASMRAPMERVEATAMAEVAVTNLL